MDLNLIIKQLNHHKFIEIVNKFYKSMLLHEFNKIIGHDNAPFNEISYTLLSSIEHHYGHDKVIEFINLYYDGNMSYLRYRYIMTG